MNISHPGIYCYLFFLFLTGMLNSCFCQNLITNPSFENGIDLSQENIFNWHKLYEHHTPDYFNQSSADFRFDAYLGGIKPKDGNAFIGIFCYRINPVKKIRNIREFIEAPLTEKLEKDSVYRFRISLCLDEESNVCLRNFGVLFTSKPKEFRESKLFVTIPDIVFDSLWLDQTENWMDLEKLYIATGKENYIVLGNFRADSKTSIRNREVNNTGKKEKWKLTKNEQAAYYYLDNLVLEKTKSELKISETKTEEVPVDDYSLEEVKKDSVVILHNVNFEFNSTGFTAGSFQELDKLLRFMENNPDISIKINGYTDNIGSRIYNLRLSLSRAEAVREYLIVHGISGHRIGCEGFGYEKPIMRNDTEANRQANRRVEFVIQSSKF